MQKKSHSRRPCSQERSSEYQGFFVGVKQLMSFCTDRVAWFFRSCALPHSFPGGKWAVAMHLLQSLPDLGILPDLRLYNTVLGSYSLAEALKVLSVLFRCWACAPLPASGSGVPASSSALAMRRCSRTPSASASASRPASARRAGRGPWGVCRRCGGSGWSPTKSPSTPPSGPARLSRT